MSNDSANDSNQTNEFPSPSRRSWWAKFCDAFRGIRFGLTHEVSFRVHIVFAIAVVLGGFLCQMRIWEWSLLILCIALVFSAEMMNTALEQLAKAVSNERNEHLGHALDLASGGVLMIAIGVAMVGTLVFVNRMLELLNC